MAVRLRSINEIPERYRNVFSDYHEFNAIQSKIFDNVFYSDTHLVLSAPTGSGKTVIFELAIIRLLMDKRWRNDFKIIYMAPMKALCAERFQDWQQKFQPLDVKCCEVTGDGEIIDFVELNTYNIILTTPEKWDSLSRKWRDSIDFVASIKLFMIDEIHLLNEQRRGPTLEAIICRMKTISSYFNSINTFDNILPNISRYIAVSATISNIEDLAKWLGGTENVKYYKISEEYRPVKLEKHVIGYPCHEKMTQFQFDMSLNYKLPQLIQKYYNMKPVMIFCSTRKGVEMMADVLSKNFHFSLNHDQRQTLQNVSHMVTCTKLKMLLTKGIAIHHAGLSYEDRGLIENLFRNGNLSALACTNTLAMGVNLPAYLVIVRSTNFYSECGVSEYTESDVLQMIGRAGRPQFDDNGVAIIMTKQQSVAKYKNLIDGTAPIESNFHKHLVEHLNSEIVLGTIKNFEVAMMWLRSTFLYVRAIKNPIFYNLPPGQGKDIIEKKLEEICSLAINSLTENGLIIKEQKHDQSQTIKITSTAYGRLMSRYYISMETMKLFRQIKGNETLAELFNILCNCHEFSEFTLRVNDKRILNELNSKKCNDKNTIRFPMQGKIKTASMKISCVIQAVLGNLSIQESSLIQESTKMIRLANRLSKCLLEYIKLSAEKYMKEFNGGSYQAILNATILVKCLQTKLWEDSSFVSKQLKKIGHVLSTLLADAGKISFNKIIEAGPREIERIVNKAPPFGNDVIDAVSKFPKYDLTFQLLEGNNKNAKVIVKQINEKYQNSFNGSGVALIIGDSNNQLLFYRENIEYVLYGKDKFEATLNINVEVRELKAHLIHHKIVGCDQQKIIELQINKDDGKNYNSSISIPSTAATSLKRKSHSLTIISLDDSDVDSYDMPENINRQKSSTAIEKLQQYASSSKPKIQKTITNNKNISLFKISKSDIPVNGLPTRSTFSLSQSKTKDFDLGIENFLNDTDIEETPKPVADTYRNVSTLSQAIKSVRHKYSMFQTNYNNTLSNIVAKSIKNEFSSSFTDIINKERKLIDDEYLMIVDNLSERQEIENNQSQFDFKIPQSKTTKMFFYE